jgi:hypothetical protein
MTDKTIPWVEDHVVSYHDGDLIRIWHLEPRTSPEPWYRIDMKKPETADPDAWRWIPLPDADGNPLLYWTEDDAVSIGVPLAQAYMAGPEWGGLL